MYFMFALVFLALYIALRRGNEGRMAIANDALIALFARLLYNILASTSFCQRVGSAPYV